MAEADVARGRGSGSHNSRTSLSLFVMSYGVASTIKAGRLYIWQVGLMHNTCIVSLYCARVFTVSLSLYLTSSHTESFYSSSLAVQCQPSPHRTKIVLAVGEISIRLPALSTPLTSLKSCCHILLSTFNSVFFFSLSQEVAMAMAYG